jgi:hypothetical protein
LIPFVYSSTLKPDGRRHATVWPLLARYSRQWEIDRGIGSKLWPFSLQVSGHQYRLRLLYLFGRYRGEEPKGGHLNDLTTTTFFQPFYHHQRQRPNVPAEFQILGGLIARDCDYERREYMYRIFWLWRVAGPYKMKPQWTVADVLSPTRPDDGEPTYAQRWGHWRPSFLSDLPQMQETATRHELGMSILDLNRKSVGLRGLGAEHPGLEKLHPMNRATVHPAKQRPRRRGYIRRRGPQPHWLQ